MKKFASIILLFCSIVNLAIANIHDPFQTKLNYYFSHFSHKHLNKFINEMPKGGDLHNHFSGAAYPQNLIKYAKADYSQINWCIKKTTKQNNSYKVYNADTKKDCLNDNGHLLRYVNTHSKLYHNLIASWSMKGFSYFPPEFGHEHFFSAFGKFGALAGHAPYKPIMLADLMRQASHEHIHYIEFMISPGQSKFLPNSTTSFTKKYLDKLPNNLSRLDILKAISILDTNKFSSDVVKANIIEPTKIMLAKAKKILRCGTLSAEPACKVLIRFIYQVKRTAPNKEILTQVYAGMLANTLSNLFVGLNLVAPEDSEIALSNYTAQMKIIGDIRRKFPKVLISLHAGELTSYLVNYKINYLKSHIYQALTIANANRIGHGVNVFTEYTAGRNIFDIMRKRNDLIEINLTSNQDILGVCDGFSYCISPGPKWPPYNHPFVAYLKAGVPVALSTDDQGILQNDLDTEYQKAVNRYHLTYDTLKNIDRNSVAYSFLPGKQLWKNAYHGYNKNDWNYGNFVNACSNDNPYNNDSVSKQCSTFLENNLKAKIEWALEVDFARFEKKQLSEH